MSDIAVLPVVYTIKNTIPKIAYIINNDFIIPYIIPPASLNCFNIGNYVITSATNVINIKTYIF